MHDALLNYKLAGSFALRCGCSSFGIRIVGNHKPIVQLVFIFSNKNKSNNFGGWLYQGGLTHFDYSFEEKIFKGKPLFLYYLNTVLFYKGDDNKSKFYFKNFRQFCNQNIVSYYNSNQSHLYHNN